jgi:hypothetical protein
VVLGLLTVPLFVFALRLPHANAQTSVFADGLTNPAGIYVDDNGFLWVASLGTGADDAGVYVISPDGEVNPFITGLPSTIVQGDPAGTNHVYFNNDRQLLIVQGQGAGEVSGSVLLVDTTGFAPGDDPLGPSDIDQVFNVSDFVTGELGGESNPYAMTFLPNSPFSYITDAAANAVVEGHGDELSIFATFDDVPNTGSQGPPMVDAVPTGVDYDPTTENLYVGTLTGFPFNEGAATIFEIDLDGNVTPLIEDLTTVVDIQVIPGGGGLVFLEHRFSPGAGRLYKWENGELMEMAADLTRPAGLRVGLNGEVYVSVLDEGQILKIEGVVTSSGREIPEADPALKVEAYPNPFSEKVMLAVEGLDFDEAHVSIVDVLGRTVFTTGLRPSQSGADRVYWMARSEGGTSLPPGPYLYRIDAGDRVAVGVVFKN